MTAALLALCCASSAIVPEPLLWLRLDGSIYIQGQASPRLREGTSVVRVPGGLGYDFDGKFSGIIVPDTPALTLTSSMSISCWIKLRSYVTRGPAGQILFRGDDRGGLDPYQLLIYTDGAVHFAVHDGGNKGVAVTSPILLERWTHVVANLDSREGTLSIWLDGERVSTTSLGGIRPMGALDTGAAPGVGIGNVQNDGIHNQPLNGTVADLRVYNAVVTPIEAGYRASPWRVPPSPGR